MFIFGMSSFVVFPYLDELSIPQRGEEGMSIMVASLIFPLKSYSYFSDPHRLFLLQCYTCFMQASITSFSGVWYLVSFLIASRLPSFGLYILECFDTLPSLPLCTSFNS